MRVTCLALLLAIAGGCDHGHTTKPVVAPVIPRALADGSSPTRLHAFRGHPVLAARELSGRADAVRTGCLDPHTRARARLSGAWLSTEGLTVEYSVSRSQTALIACDKIRVGQRWERCGLGAARSRVPGRIELAGGGLSVACGVAFMWIAVPDETAWALVDHGSFWLAYPTAGRRLIRVSKTAISGLFHLAFLDRHGRLFREKSIRGVVAG